MLNEVTSENKTQTEEMVNSYTEAYMESRIEHNFYEKGGEIINAAMGANMSDNEDNDEQCQAL